jgi:hypothetical protein
MKTIKLGLGIFFVFGHLVSSQADLFTPGAYFGTLGTDYGIGASTLPDGQGDGAAFEMGLDLSNLAMPILQSVSYSGTIGIGHAWYETTINTVIDEAFATSTPYFYRGAISGDIQITLSLPFYLAFWLDANESGSPDVGDVYGWAELVWDGSELQLLDSAAENDGVGIIAGTYTQIPEPATILLLGLGGIGAWLLRRNKRPVSEV